MLEKLPSPTGGWLVDELLEDGLLLELLEDGLLLLEDGLLLELLLLLELALDELEGLFDSLDAGALDSESVETGIELLSTSLLGSLLSWLLFEKNAHEERINVDKKARLRNIFLFCIDVTPLLIIFSYVKKIYSIVK